MINKKSLFFIILFIFISLFTRFNNLGNFYTEVDDVISIEHLITYDKLQLYDIANDEDSQTYNSKIKRYLRELQSKENNFIDYTQKKISSLLFNLTPSKTSTYAPLQFFMFGWMVDSDQNYYDLKFYSRLPSAIFSILTIFVTFLLSRKLFKKEMYYIFLPCLLLLCSYPIIFISQRSYNYSAGVFAITLLFYLFLRENINLKNTKVLVDKKKINYKKNFYFSIILTLTSYLSYISIILMPAFFIFKFIKSSFKEKNILIVSNYNLLISGLMYSIMIFPLLLYMLSLDLQNYGATDSSGIFGEYSIVDKQGKYMQFFLYNFYLIVTKNLSFFLDDFVGANIIQNLIFIITVIGIINIFQKNVNNKYQTLLHLFVMILFYWIALVCFNQTTFGPTRHLLWLTPIIAILFASGLKTINKLIFRTNLFFSIFILSSIIIVFSLNYSNFLNYHNDLYSEKKINNLIKKYNIKYIVNDAGTAHQICLMTSVNVRINTCPIRNNRYSIIEKLNNNIFKQVKNNEGSIAFISYDITKKINQDLKSNNFDKVFVSEEIKFLFNKSPLYVAKQIPNIMKIIIYK